MPPKFTIFGHREGAEGEEDPGSAVEKKFGELDKKITDSQTETKNTLASVTSTLSAIEKRFEREDNERAEAERKRKEAETRKAQEASASRTAEEEAELMLTDPRKYIAEQTSGATRLALIATAKQMRDETLSDEPYYHGEFKRKVDALIDGEQNLALRANPQFIKNCYKVVKADHTDQIVSGELKSKAAMFGFGDGAGSSGKGAGDDKVSVVYEDDGKSKFAAKAMGITDDDIIDAAKKRAVKGLEVLA